jgi:alkylhydroperoxidase/carboxymuconolactone decarboxylase family protein YurZ
MEKFAELTQEIIFGTLWTRSGLDIKTRTLICVISDMATGRIPELKVHIRFARNHAGPRTNSSSVHDILSAMPEHLWCMRR